MSKAFCYFTLALTFVFLLVNCAPNKSNSTKLGRAKDGRGANPDAPTSHVKIGNDQLADQAKSKLAAADPKQRQVNDQAAKELVSVHMRLTDGKVALQITPANAQPITLEAELKDKKANFESQDKKIKASLSCQDKENTCLTATVDIELTKANAKANIAAIIRNMNGKVKTAQLDTTGKSETLTKFYDLLSSQERNATAENSLKTVIIQTSEIMNSQGIATSSARFMLVSKENEVIGLQGPLRLIAQGTKGKTNITLVKNIDKSLFSESIRENLQKAILKAELQEAGAS